jgi:hypothetical protein
MARILTDYNWLDLGAVAAIGIFLLIGLSSGLIFSAFRIVSMFVSLLMSLSFYEKLASLARGTLVEEIVSNMVYGGLRSRPAIMAAQAAMDVDGVRSGIASALRLPPNVADALFTRPSSLSDIPRTSLFGDMDIIKYFSDECTGAVISIVSVIAMYAVIRLLISVLKIFLDEVAPLKMFRIFNLITGPVLGVVEGLAVVYMALAGIMLVNIVVQQDIVYTMIDDAKIAKALYDNNLFLDFAINRL